MSRDEGHDCHFAVMNHLNTTLTITKETAYCKYYNAFIGFHDYSPPPKRNMGYCKGFYVAEEMRADWEKRQRSRANAISEDYHISTAQVSPSEYKVRVRENKRPKRLKWFFLYALSSFILILIIMERTYNGPAQTLDIALILIVVFTIIMTLIRLIGFIINR